MNHLAALSTSHQGLSASLREPYLRAAEDGPRTDTAAVRVYVIDDQPLFLQGLSAALSTERGLRSVGTATTLAQALQEAQSLAPDVVLVNTMLPGQRSADTIATLRTLMPRTRLVGMSCTLRPEDVRQVLAAGAAGYLLKSTTADEMQTALLAVARGQVALSPAVRTALEAPVSATAADPQLTRRERDLLGLLAQGLGNKAIAEEMAVSIPTVKFHVTNVLWKLRADNRTAAVVKAVQQHIVSL